MLARTPRPLTPPEPKTLADGIVDLPAGKIAAVATYLEMRAPPDAPGPPFAGRLVSMAGDLPRYRALYGAVGEPWLWFSRAVMSDARLRSVISDRDVEPYALAGEGGDLGIVELDFRQAGECELAFFGLVPGLQGRGIGLALLREAIRLAFLRPIGRLWLHTCTLDHPAALPVYVKAGFRPYRRAIEVADDPRRSGHLPGDAAPLFPVL